MSDNLKFRQRLQACVDKAGSIYALAKKAGMPSGTIRRYFADSEPTRPKLIAIAQAADVSVAWLATGEGQSTGQPVQPNQTELHPLPDGFTSRFAELITDLGGTDKLSELTGIARQRLESLCRGDAPTLKELHDLVVHRVASLDWLLVGSDFNASPHIRALLLNALLSNMTKWDKANRLPRILDHNVYLGPTENTSIEGIVEFWGKTYEKIAASDYICFRIPDESMEPLLDAGDVVLIDTRKPKISAGIYLVATRSGKVIVKAWNTGEKILACYLSNQDHPFELSPDACVGKAVWVFKPVSLRNSKQVDT